MKLELSERAGEKESVEAPLGSTLRVFRRSEEPFEVTDAEAAELLPTGLFTPAEAMKIRFKEKESSPKADVRSGYYRRTFVRSEQPFLVTKTTWERFIKPTGLFEAVQEKKPPQTTEDKKQTTTGSAGGGGGGGDAS